MELSAAVLYYVSLLLTHLDKDKTVIQIGFHV